MLLSRVVPIFCALALPALTNVKLIHLPAFPPGSLFTVICTYRVVSSSMVFTEKFLCNRLNRRCRVSDKGGKN